MHSSTARYMDPVLCIYNMLMFFVPATSPQVRHLISRILDPDPSTRIKAHEIRKDPWFKQGYVRVYAFKEDEEAAESTTSSSAKDLAAIFPDMAVSERGGG